MADEDQVPARYRISFDELRHDQNNMHAIEKVKRLAESFGVRSYDLCKDNDGREVVKVSKELIPERGLILYGKVGTGKSTLLGALALSVYANGHSAKWIHWTNLVKKIAPRNRDEDIFDSLAKTSCLIVDDLGKFVPPDFIVAHVGSLIELRYGSKLPIVAATNATKDELQASIGLPALSRLHEMCEQIEVLGPDRRLVQVATM